MRVAIDIRFINDSEFESFVKDTFSIIANKHKQHEFIFILAEPSNSVFSEENISCLISTPKLINTLGLKWEYDIKLPLLLKKHKFDVLVCANGLASTTTAIPQVLVVNNIAFSKFSGAVSKAPVSFYKTYTTSFIKKAKAVLTLSEFVKSNIIDTYKIAPEKVDTTGAFVSDVYKPVDWEEREEIKEKWSQGFEYFLFPGGFHPINNAINVLKAFSTFKKWQKTGLKLLITGDLSDEHKEYIDKLQTYKYRQEVIVLPELTKEQLAKIVGSAYAIIFPALDEGFAWNAAKALLSEVPMILTEGGSGQELAGEAALYVDANNPQQIADEMRRLFKDEHLRSSLITAGKGLFINDADWVTDLIWKAVQPLVSQ